jgi:Suppressor of fused protein (SUFU)
LSFWQSLRRRKKDLAQITSQDYAPSGAPIWRYGAPKKSEGGSGGDSQLIEAVSEHIEKHIGTINMVFHEIVSQDVHVDIYHVAPTSNRDYHTLITSGMSEKAMRTPEGAEEFRYAELMLGLPASWIGEIDCHKPTTETFPSEEKYWPVRWLTLLARFPHQYETYLSWGHTIPNNDPPEAFAANTEMCCVLLVSPSLLPEEAHTIAIGRKKEVHLWAVVPIYPEELELKLTEGAERLEELFRQYGVTELLDPRRVNVVTGKRRAALM